MQTLIIDQRDSKLSHERNRLVIHHANLARPISVPFNQINDVIVNNSAMISTGLLAHLAKYEIALTILPTSRQSTACRLLGDWQGDISRRLLQYDVFCNNEQQLIWAKRLICIKLHRQAHVIYTLAQQTTHTPILTTAIHTLKQGIQDLQNATSLDSIRGIEGGMAGVFFTAYQSCFHEQWQFNNRNRRPPTDPINVLLSLGYHLLQALCENAVYAVGFDPYLGILHRPSYNRQSLACDIAELFRADIETWIWQLIQNEQINYTDFSHTANKERPCELLKTGRHTFYSQWAKLKPKLQKRCQKAVYTLYHRLKQDNGNSTTLHYLSDDIQGE